MIGWNVAAWLPCQTLTTAGPPAPPAPPAAPAAPFAPVAVLPPLMDCAWPPMPDEPPVEAAPPAEEMPPFAVPPLAEVPAVAGPAAPPAPVVLPPVVLPAVLVPVLLVADASPLVAAPAVLVLVLVPPAASPVLLLVSPVYAFASLPPSTACRLRRCHRRCRCRRCRLGSGRAATCGGRVCRTAGTAGRRVADAVAGDDDALALSTVAGRAVGGVAAVAVRAGRAPRAGARAATDRVGSVRAGRVASAGRAATARAVVACVCVRLLAAQVDRRRRRVSRGGIRLVGAAVLEVGVATGVVVAGVSAAWSSRC